MLGKVVKIFAYRNSDGIVLFDLKAYQCDYTHVNHMVSSSMGKPKVAILLGTYKTGWLWGYLFVIESKVFLLIFEKKLCLLQGQSTSTSCEMDLMLTYRFWWKISCPTFQTFLQKCIKNIQRILKVNRIKDCQVHCLEGINPIYELRILWYFHENVCTGSQRCL